MAIWNIAINNVKRTLGNAALILILIILPIVQMMIINSIAGGAATAPIGHPVLDTYVETVILDNIARLPMMQLFAAGTLVQYLLIGGMIAAVMIITQRENKTLMRIFTCPVSKFEIITGNLAGLSLVVLAIAAVFIMTTGFALGVHWGYWPGALLITVFVIYAAASMGFLTSAIFKRAKMAGAFMSFFLTAMTFLSDSINFSGNFGAVSSFTLNKWAYEAYNKLMEGRGMESVFINLLVLGLVGTAFLAAATMLYRREGIYE